MWSAGQANFYTQAFTTGYNTSMAFGNEITNASLARNQARMNAAAYRSQARMNLMAAQRQNAYLNEELGQNVWNTYDDARIFGGKQRAAMAASGFADISSRDRDLTRETALRADAVATGMNRTAYLQSFETERQARMEATRLEYAAKAQDVIRKQYSPLNAFISASFAGLGAFAQGASNTMSSYGNWQNELKGYGPVYGSNNTYSKTFQPGA